MQLFLCFCWQHCRFCVHGYAWFSSYHNCASLKLLGQFLLRNSNVNDGRSTFSLHHEREEFSDSYFVTWKGISGRNPSTFYSKLRERCLLQSSVCIWMEKLKNVPTCLVWRNWYIRDLLLSENIFSEGQKKFVQRWKKCIERKEKTLKNNVIIRFIFLLK